MNLLGFTPPFFDVLKQKFELFMQQDDLSLNQEFFLPSAVTALVEEFNVKIPVIASPERTYGVTYKEDKPVVKEMIKSRVAEGQYPGQLWAT